MTEILDPRIEIQHIPDGEVHIIINWKIEDLWMLTSSFIAVSEGKMSIDEAKSVLRIKSQIGLKYIIAELQKSII